MIRAAAATGKDMLEANYRMEIDALHNREVGEKVTGAENKTNPTATTTTKTKPRQGRQQPRNSLRTIMQLTH